MAIAFNAKTGAANNLLGAHRFVQAGGQADSQPFAGHFKDVIQTRFTRTRFQIHSRAAVQVENVTQVIHECADRGDLQQ